MESEKLTEKYLVKKIKALGGLTVKGNSKNFRGFPDRVICLSHGKVGFLEVKSEGKTTTVLQQHWLDLLSDLGFKTGVADTKAKVDKFLEEVVDAD